MIREIKDIYSYQKNVPAPMLSDYSADFWSQYLLNYPEYDRIFMKKYRSWFPMDQAGDIDEIAADFAADVKSWLTINDKRYSELFRLQTIVDNADYSLVDNVSEHETISTLHGKKVTFDKGAQTISDSGSDIYGSRTDTQDNERIYGQQSIDTDATNITGDAGKTTINSTSAYNESEYTGVDKVEETDDARTDTIDETIVKGSHTDTEDLSTTYGGHTDTKSNTRTDGARQDITTDSGTDTVTRDRHGNIGVKTVDQMLGEHRDFWVDFSFYEIIFADIARELLRGWH